MIVRSPGTKSPIYADLGADALWLLSARGGRSLSLERDGDGRLTEDSRRRVGQALRELGPVGGAVVCGVPGRGVSLRQVTLPPGPDTEIDRLLSLQLEREFPLPPEELAWTYRLGDVRNGDAPPRREATVVALRLDVIQEYRRVFDEHGFLPRFRVGVFAGRAMVEARGKIGVIDVGRDSTEIAWFDQDQPIAVRTVPAGMRTLTRRIALALELDEPRAAETRRRWLEGAALSPADDEALEQAAAHVRQELVARILDTARSSGCEGSVAVLVLTGEGADLPGLPEALAEAFPTARHERLATGSDGETTVTLGMRRQDEKRLPRFELGAESEVEASPRIAQGAPWGWTIGAVALFAIGLMLPLLAPDPNAEKAVEARERLSRIPDFAAELAFLESLDARDVWPLESLEMVRRLAPEGFALGKLLVDRQRRLTVAGSLPKKEQVHELRRRLTSCGVKSLALPEINYDGDRERWTFRLVGKLESKPTVREGVLPETTPTTPSTNDPTPGGRDTRTPVAKGTTTNSQATDPKPSRASEGRAAMPTSAVADGGESGVTDVETEAGGDADGELTSTDEEEYPSEPAMEPTELPVPIPPSGTPMTEEGNR